MRRPWLMVKFTGLLLACSAGTSPTHFTKRNPDCGVALTETELLAEYHESVTLTLPRPAIPAINSYSVALQFQERLELVPIVNEIKLVVPLAGTLPVPDQPVQR